jgi:SAM-dependent methyltransferase
MQKIKTEFVTCPLCNENQYVTISKGGDFECNISDQEFTMVRCSKCGLIRLNPRPAIDQLDIIYSSTYNAYNFEKKLGKLMKFIREIYLKKMITPLKKIIPNDAKILEGGCGDGEFLINLQKYGHADWKLFGNDISNTPRVKLANALIPFFPGRFEDLNFINQFDVIILKDVIEHLDQPGLVFQSVNHALQDNGLLIIETPNPDSWDAQIFQKRYWAGWHFPRHWTIYNKKLIACHLEKYGFRIIKFNSNLSPVSWLYSIKYLLSERKVLSKFAFLFDEKFFFTSALFYIINLFQVLFTGTTANVQILARKVVKCPE